MRELTNGISSGPDNEVGGNDYCFLCLPGNVSRNHGQVQGLGRPEGQSDVVADQHADLTGEVVRLDCHQQSCADERWETVSQHDQEVLVGLLNKPSGRQQHDQNVEAQNHSQELSLQHTEAEAADNDVGKRTQARRGKGRSQGNDAVTPCLRVLESFDDLVHLESLVLNTGLVLLDSHDLKNMLTWLFGGVGGCHTPCLASRLH